MRKVSKSGLAVLCVCLGISASMMSGCEDTAKAFCNPGVTRCNGTAVEVCGGVTWVQMSDCATYNTTCSEETGMCDYEGLVPEGVEDAECAAQVNPDVCVSDTAYKSCVNYKWEEKSCGANETCDSEHGKCVSSSSGGSSEPVASVCSEGDVKCSSDNSGRISCVDGQWGEVEPCGEGEKCDASDNACKAESEVVAECSADVCEDNALKPCVEGKWGEVAACPEEAPVCNAAGTACEAAQSEDECSENGAFKACSEDGASITVCANGKWETTACSLVGDGYVCSADEKSCVAPAAEDECAEGELKCNDSADGYYSCVEGKWSESATACKGDKSLCFNNECVEPCVDKCSDDGKIYKCDSATNSLSESAVECESSSDGEAQSCQSIKSSSGGQNSTVDMCAPACTENETICSDDLASVMTCKRSGGNYAWSVSACDSDEYCGTSETMMGSQVSCIEKVCSSADAFKCVESGVSGEYYKCDVSSWNYSESEKGSCPEGQICVTTVSYQSSSSSCMVCEAGSYKCDESGNFLVCKDDGSAWETKASCGSADACVDTSSGFNSVLGCSCSAGDTQCDSSNSSVMKCTTETLSGYTRYNAWVEDTTCDAGACKVVSGKAVCGCTSSSCSADGSTMNICNNGTVTAQACEDGFSCSISDGTASCLCKSGAKRCGSTTGGYKTTVYVETCNEAGTAYEYEKDDVCSSGGCSDELGSVCLTDTVCTESSGYTGDADKCDGANIMTCDGGLWAVKETCSGDQVCVSKSSMGSTTVSCGEASESCSGNAQRCATVDGKAVIQQCIKGAWTTSKSCEDKQICVAKTSSYGPVQSTSYSCADKVCDEYALSCSEKDASVIQVCSENALVDIAKCSGKCDNGACVD